VLHWYYRGPAPVVTVYDVWVRNLPDLERRVDEWSRERRRVWLLISRPWLQDPEFRLRSVLERRFGPGEVRSFDGVTLVSYDVRQESSR
jgi:hypothetical protein